MMIFKNIPIGTYYPGQSLLHRLQARTKLLLFLVFIVCLTIANHHIWHFTPYIVVVLLVGMAITLSGISPGQLWQRMWLLVLLVVIGAITSLLTPDIGDKRLHTFGPYPLPYTQFFEGLFVYALVLAPYIFILLLRTPGPLQGNPPGQAPAPIRLANDAGASPAAQSGQTQGAGPRSHLRHSLSLLASLRKQRWFRLTGIGLAFITSSLLADLWLIQLTPSAMLIGPLILTYNSVWFLLSGLFVFLVLYTLTLLLTMTTSPVALIEGLTLLLTPLRWLKLPVDEFALMTLLALRFIPTLIDEIEQLIKAQASRGADFSHGTLRERLQSVMALFIPFIQTTLRRASELAIALESRGYESDGHPTQMHEQSLRILDYAVLAVVTLVMVAALLA